MTPFENHSRGAGNGIQVGRVQEDTQRARVLLAWSWFQKDAMSSIVNNPSFKTHQCGDDDIM